MPLCGTRERVVTKLAQSCVADNVAGLVVDFVAGAPVVAVDYLGAARYVARPTGLHLGYSLYCDVLVPDCRSTKRYTILLHNFEVYNKFTITLQNPALNLDFSGLPGQIRRKAVGESRRLCRRDV